MDRRKKYTRMVLNESLIQLLEKKDITRITVTELCKDADVNRSTYYAHYTDPFDQLIRLKTELLNDLTEYAQRIDTRQLGLQEQKYLVLKAILQYIDTKRHIFRILLTKNGDYQLQQEILTILGEKAFSIASTNRNAEDREYLLLFVTNGCFGMFHHWLLSEHPISADQLARMMSDFTSNILS